MEFLEVPFFDDDVYKLLVRLAINLLVVCAVVLGCYRLRRKDDIYSFTFLLLNVMVFFICFALKKLELELGLALGLFAIFGIIRYRTESISVREMTYLFVVVGIAVINALSNKKTSYVELAVTNGVVIGASFVLERWFGGSLDLEVMKNGTNGTKGNGSNKGNGSKKGSELESKSNKETDLPNVQGLQKQTVVYDKLNLLGPSHRKELIDDIEQRLGMLAEHVDVGKIDFVKGSANLTIYFKDIGEPA